MSTYKPTVIINGRENQLDEPDGLTASHVTDVDYIDFDIVDGDSVPHAEGRLHWHDSDGTLSLGMPGGSVELQLGQEMIVRAKNTTGNDVPNGTIVYPVGSTGNNLEFGIASNNAPSFPANQPFGVTTENIASNQLGYVTVFGLVRELDTSTFNEGDLLYLGVDGAFTATPPEAPRTLALCGAVVRKHATEGSIVFRWGESIALNTLADVYAPFGGETDGDTIGWVTANNRYEVYNPNTPGPYTKAGFFNGTFRETFDLRLNSDGTNVWASLEKSGGGDLTLQWSNGQFPFDCTPAQTINLTPGTDAQPNSYYLYIPHTTNTLTSNPTLWPLGVENNKIAYVLVPSAQFVLDHGGGYINQNFNDHLAGDDDNGHMVHMAMKIRQQGADWYSGVSPDGATDSYFTYNTGNVYWQSTEGLVSQMHAHTFQSQNTANADVAIVVNDPDSTYNHIQNFYTGITKDSTGTTLGTNRYFKLVFWGVCNKTGEGDRIMVNLPSGTYTSASGAEADLSNYAFYNFPREFDIESGVAFLICEVVFQKQGTGWAWQSTADLRGLSPSKIAGGGSGGTSDHGALGGLADDDHTQYVLADGTRAFTGNVTISANTLTLDGWQFEWDSANNIAYQTLTGGSGHFERIGDAYPVARDVCSTAITNGRRAVTEFVHRTSGIAADGLAAGCTFAIAEGVATPNFLAGIYGVRNGSDQTGDLQFFTRNAGTFTNKMTIGAGGDVTILAGTITANNIDVPSGAAMVLASTNPGTAAFTTDLSINSVNASVVTATAVGTSNIVSANGTVNFATSNIVTTGNIAGSKVIVGSDTPTYSSLMSIHTDLLGAGIQSGVTKEGKIESTNNDAYGTWQQFEVTPANGKDAYGHLISLQVNTGVLNTIDEAVGLQIDPVANTFTGDISTVIGLRLRDQSIGTVANWALYCEGDAYFGADVSFGGFTLTNPTTANQILQSTAADAASWTTDITGLTSLQVDNLTFNDTAITSATGIINLTNRVHIGSATSNPIVGLAQNQSLAGSLLVAGHQILGSYTSTDDHVYLSRLAGYANPAGGSQARGQSIELSVGTGAANNIEYAIGAFIGTFAKSGTGTIQKARSLYINGQTEGTVDNWSIYVYSGDSFFGGNLTVNSNSQGVVLGASQQAHVFFDGNNLELDPNYNDTDAQVFVRDAGVITKGTAGRSHHLNKFQHVTANARVDGTMKLRLPHTWMNYWIKVKISGQDYTTGAHDGTWAVDVAYYPFTAPAFYAYTASITGDPPFRKVRLAHDGTAVCLLLGTEDDIWSYPRFQVDLEYDNSAYASMATPMTVDFSTDEGTDWSLTNETSVPIYPLPTMWMTEESTSRTMYSVAGTIHDDQPTPTDSANSYTLVVADLLTKILTGTPTANVTYTLPTGTVMDAGTDVPYDGAIEWSIINLASATYTITVSATTLHTVVGNMVVQPATSGRFLSRRVTGNTWVTYRLA
jgi:hypothetical protein